MYQTLIDRRQKRIRRHPVPVRPVPSHRTIVDSKNKKAQTLVLAPPSYDFTFLVVEGRERRSPKETLPSGGPTSSLFWSHQYQNPSVAQVHGACVARPPIRAGRLREPGSAWTAASSTSRLGR